MQQFSRPQAARQIEARARAKQRGVRVEVIEPRRWYRTRSQSNPGEVYNLARVLHGWQCSCPGYLHTGVCKHLGQLERRSEREGWAFGRIAPRLSG
jgi:hypothetical protein